MMKHSDQLQSQCWKDTTVGSYHIWSLQGHTQYTPCTVLNELVSQYVCLYMCSSVEKQFALLYQFQ